MVCINHHDRNGVNTCSKCGEWLCEGCSIEAGNRIICGICAAKSAEGSAAEHRPPAAHGFVPPRQYSTFLVFIFSCLPGAAHMYMGLMKRGLLALTAFFAFIFIGHRATGMLVPILMITCFFDAMHTRRRLNSGVHVPDTVDGILNWVRKYKGVLLIVGGFLLLSELFNGFRWLGFSFFTHSPLMVAALCVILFLIFSTKKDKKSDKRERDSQGDNAHSE